MNLRTIYKNNDGSVEFSLFLKEHNIFYTLKPLKPHIIPFCISWKGTYKKDSDMYKIKIYKKRDILFNDKFIDMEEPHIFDMQIQNEANCLKVSANFFDMQWNRDPEMGEIDDNPYKTFYST